MQNSHSKANVVDYIRQQRVRAFGRNTVLNLGGQLVVAAIALVTLPFIVRTLQADAYGLLALALSAFGLSSLLDLGLGRATTNAVADRLGAGIGAPVSAVVWTSVTIQVLAGTFGGLILFSIAPFLVATLAHVPSNLIVDATREFRLLALAAPLIMMSAALRGVLEGAQRFDFVNYVRVPLNASSYLLPLLGARLHFSVTSIVLLLVLARLAATLAYVGCCVASLPELTIKPQFRWTLFGRLMRYGGWVSVSNVVTPILSQLDRYIIGWLVGLGALTYYVVPVEMLNGLYIIPMSVVSTLFPLISSLRPEERASYLGTFFARPIKYIFVSLGPMVLALIALAPDVLSLWQGPTFAARSVHVLQILAGAVLISSLGWVPGCLLNGISRPDVVAKIQLVQLPVYLVCAYLMISSFGILGAALTFTVRVMLETLMNFWASFRLQPVAYRALCSARPLRALLILSAFSSPLILMNTWHLSIASHVVFTLVVLLAYVGSVWVWLFDATDRELIWSCGSILSAASIPKAKDRARAA